MSRNSWVAAALAGARWSLLVPSVATRPGAQFEGKALDAGLPAANPEGRALGGWGCLS